MKRDFISIEQTPSICIIDPRKKAIILPNDMCVKVVENDKTLSVFIFDVQKLLVTILI